MGGITSVQREEQIEVFDIKKGLREALQLFPETLSIQLFPDHAPASLERLRDSAVLESGGGWRNQSNRLAKFISLQCLLPWL